MPLHEYPDKGRCRSCGYLSKHATRADVLPSPRFYEAEHTERINVGALFRHAIDYREWIGTEPMCFVDEISFMQIIAADKQSDMECKLEDAILEYRNCPGWYPYMPGFSPMEHYQVSQMRAYEARIETDRIAREDSYRRQDRALIITGLILAAGQVAAAVIFGIISYRDSYTDQILRRLFGE